MPGRMVEDIGADMTQVEALTNQALSGNASGAAIPTAPVNLRVTRLISARRPRHPPAVFPRVGLRNARLGRSALRRLARSLLQLSRDVADQMADLVAVKERVPAPDDRFEPAAAIFGISAYTKAGTPRRA